TSRPSMPPARRSARDGNTDRSISPDATSSPPPAPRGISIALPAARTPAGSLARVCGTSGLINSSTTRSRPIERGMSGDRVRDAIPVLQDGGVRTAEEAVMRSVGGVLVGTISGPSVPGAQQDRDDSDDGRR